MIVTIWLIGSSVHLASLVSYLLLFCLFSQISHCFLLLHFAVSHLLLFPTSFHLACLHNIRVSYLNLFCLSSQISHCFLLLVFTLSCLLLFPTCFHVACLHIFCFPLASLHLPVLVLAMALIALLAWGDRYPFLADDAPSQQGPALFLDELSQAVAGTGATLRQGCQSELYHFSHGFSRLLLVCWLLECPKFQMLICSFHTFQILILADAQSNELRCAHMPQFLDS